ncbi:MAG: hypothetical protein QM692_20575, partial [Thermomicrobiales bacterium]
ALTPSPSPDARERGADWRRQDGRAASPCGGWHEAGGKKPLSRASGEGLGVRASPEGRGPFPEGVTLVVTHARRMSRRAHTTHHATTAWRVSQENRQ